MQVHDMSLWIQSQIWESCNLQSLGPPVSSHQVIQQVRRSIYSLAFPNHICTLHLQMYCLNTGRKVVAKQKVPSNILVNLTCQILTLIDMLQNMLFGTCYLAITFLPSEGDKCERSRARVELFADPFKTEVSIYPTFWGYIIPYWNFLQSPSISSSDVDFSYSYPTPMYIHYEMITTAILSPSAPLNSSWKLEKSSENFWFHLGDCVTFWFVRYASYRYAGYAGSAGEIDTSKKEVVEQHVLNNMVVVCCKHSIGTCCPTTSSLLVSSPRESHPQSLW